MHSLLMNSFTGNPAWTRWIHPSSTMFNHLSSRSSVEDWYKHICETQDPRRLTKILISNRSFIDKANLLMALPPTVSEKSVDMRWLESKLEDTGYSQLAQIVRWNIFWRLSKDSRKANLNWSQKVVVADITGRWIVQRRTYLQEEIRYLRKFLSVPLISAVEAENKDASKKIYQLSAYEEELQHQDRRIWDHAQLYWKLEVEMPSGCQERAFRALQTGPKLVYMCMVTPGLCGTWRLLWTRLRLLREASCNQHSTMESRSLH